MNPLKAVSAPRRAPIPYRLAARALRVAETIRRDHGDDKLADLLVALAQTVQREHGNARNAARMRVALKALHEIAIMSTNPAVVAKCHAVIGQPHPQGDTTPCPPPTPTRP